MKLLNEVAVVDDGEWRVDEPWPRCWSGEPHSLVIDFWGNSECAFCHVRAEAPVISRSSFTMRNAMTQQNSDGEKEVRIICDGLHRPVKSAAGEILSMNGFIRECYDWWREGCNCDACAVVNSYESNSSNAAQFHWRMSLLYDLATGRHGDGVHLPRRQLQLFVDRV